jgi:1,4-alpha-glucan branching enzyme
MEWFLLSFPYHSGVQRCVKELNHFYTKTHALWADDFSFEGFEWLDFSDSNNSIISYLRKVPKSADAVLVVHNFTPTYFEHYELPARHVRQLDEIMNTDDCQYGGSGKVHTPVRYHHSNEGRTHKLILSIPPLATVVYKVHWQ